MPIGLLCYKTLDGDNFSTELAILSERDQLLILADGVSSALETDDNSCFVHGTPIIRQL